MNTGRSEQPGAIGRIRRQVAGNRKRVCSCAIGYANLLPARECLPREGAEQFDKLQGPAAVGVDLADIPKMKSRLDPGGGYNKGRKGDE